MRNVKFSVEVVKELRRLVRDSSKGLELQAALKRIYTTGFDNGQAEATKRIKEVLSANNKSSNPGHDDDGEQLQPASGKYRVSQRADADDPNSSEGSERTNWISGDDEFLEWEA